MRKITMNFGDAIACMKAGSKIARQGWNGKNMFIVYQEGYPDGIECTERLAKKLGLRNGEMVVVRPYMQMKCADGALQMWLASQSYILAEDWVTVEGAEK